MYRPVLRDASTIKTSDEWLDTREAHTDSQGSAEYSPPHPEREPTGVGTGFTTTQRSNQLSRDNRSLLHGVPRFEKRSRRGWPQRQFAPARLNTSLQQGACHKYSGRTHRRGTRRRRRAERRVQRETHGREPLH